ncbi:MAG: beta-exotoxin transport system ATP-binding protein [Actinomycetota bacterium]|nr:beta-exotoxin transport system ATP-binding protein [Actinomycetota bacterium]
MEDIIRCEGLTKRFGTFTALDALDLRVGPGTVFGYLGPNGAGKSTTLRMLVGLTRPVAGKCAVFGQDPASSPAMRARLGYVPGELRLDDRMTVGGTLELWTRIRGMTETKYRDELLQRFDIDPGRAVRGLSTGNRRKVGLIGAFMGKPELLILDEPTNGLDPLMQQQFLAAIEEAKDEGRTVLLSSHVLSEVERVADTVAVLRKGRLVAQGRLTDLVQDVRQTFRIQFESEPVPVDEITRLPGATEVEVVGTTVNLRWTGAPESLLAVLGRHRLRAMRAPEPELEEAFLRFYEDATEGADR